MTVSRVIPGQVINNGFKDDSIVASTPTLPSSPCHYPVLSLVTPKGPLGQQFINAGDFTSIYGDITDVDSPYYNPIAQLIQMITSGGQASFGVRRVTGNTQLARVALGIMLTPSSAVPQYQRNTDGSYMYDTNGALIPVTNPTALTGYLVQHVIYNVTDANTGAWGQLKTTTSTANGVTSTIYPLYEFGAGVGDLYNSNGLMLGLDPNGDQTAIADWVETYGVYPFTMKMYTKNKYGTPVYATLSGSSVVYQQFTLFNMMDVDSVRYSLSQAVGAYTGDNANRPHVSTAAPFNQVYTYDANIAKVCSLLYAAESAYVNAQLVTVDGVQPYKQMNPLTCVNHEGIPYYTIVLQGTTQPYNLSTYLDAKGGVNPFLTSSYLPAGPVTGTYQFDPTKNNGVADVLSSADAWSISQTLILADLQAYAVSNDLLNWTRNRQSVIWDVGYNTDIKNALIDVFNARKDQILILQASVWGQTTTVAQRYSLMQTLATKVRLLPESALYGTPACRCSISVWDGNIIDEATGGTFPLTLDLAYQFAKIGGNASGYMSATNSPDHGDNRILTKMYNPTITFESDDAAANNFDEGGITIRPYDDSQYYRPALPTVYNDGNSVLKDLMTNFTGVCIEKIMMDSWTLVSGDTTLTAAQYQATVKDQVETTARKRLGTMFTSITTTCSYSETGANTRSVMNASSAVYFRKGYYMMNMELDAYNEQDATATS